MKETCQSRDEWSGLAYLLADPMEKYIPILDLDSMPPPKETPIHKNSKRDEGEQK